MTIAASRHRLSEVLRPAVLVGLWLIALALWAGSAAAETLPAYKATYHGTSRPPGTITEDHKTIWMTEWVACNRITMPVLARQLQVQVPKTTPLQASRILAQRAMQFLYETTAEMNVAIDGCRNGILWRFFHGRGVG